SIYMSLESAGVTANTYWWSFSNSDGSWNTTVNCGGGTSGSGNGRYGHKEDINTKWISDGNGQCWQTVRDLICIAKP
ncbi:MAG: hypothetical protein ACPHS0_02825, partial [bacterium]